MAEGLMGGTMELTEEGTPRELGIRGSDPLIGQRLLHYRVLEEIGQGGMSVVYRGRDEQLGRDVAIKVLHPFLAQKTECRQRLAREARAVAKLEHENILRIFGYSGDPPTLDEKPDGERNDPHGLQRDTDSQEGFLVVEFVPGDTLKQWALRSNVWEMPEIGALVTCALAKALAHAHAQGVIHRDLKPENVMIRDDGMVKLMDFGIAQVADAKSLTITGTLLGSPAHMAPESIEGYPADERSDIFSLGTVLYWLTTGALPFEALTPHALLKAIVDGKCSPPQQRQPRISDELATIIKRSMATRPADRYESAEEMADALDDYLLSLGLDTLNVWETLANPIDAKASLSKRVREKYLEKAEALLADGHAAKALGALSRVLAEFPGDPAATALLERAHVDFEADDLVDADDANDSADTNGMNGIAADGSATERGSDVDTEESLPAHLRRARDSEGGLVASPTGQPRPDRGRDDPISPRVMLRRTGLVAAVVGVITLAVVVSNAIEPSRANGSEPAMAPPIESGKMRIDAAGNIPSTDRVRPRSTPLRADALPSKVQISRSDPQRPRLRPTKLVSPQIPPGRVPVDPTASDVRVAKSPGAAGTSDPTNGVNDNAENLAKGVARTVEIRVVPWADIYVDGKRVAENAKVAQVAMLPGRHVVKLTNLKAVEAVREIDVPVSGHIPQVRVRLVPKPANLIVRANVDADVLLQSATGGGRRFVGTATNSRKEPIKVSFAHRAERRFEVVLHKSGYQSVVRQVTFAAGETTEITAVLEPDANGETQPGRQPITPDR